MKYLIILLPVLSLFSCSSDDDNSSSLQVNQEYLEQLSGLYRINDAYFDKPLDLNGDGIKNFKLSDEIVYASMSTILETYDLKFYVWGSRYNQFAFDIPYSDFDIITQSYTSEIMSLQVGRQINIDSQNETFTLAIDDHKDNFIYEQYKAKILDLTWEDRKAVLTLESELFTSENVWETVILTMEYEWEHDNI